MPTAIAPVTVDRPLSVADDPRAALRRDGYAHLRGILDREAVVALRSDLFHLAADAGWLAAGTRPDDGLPGPRPRDESDGDEYFDLYRRVQSLEAFHRLGHSPALIAAVEHVLGEQALCLPLKMCRYRFPQAGVQPTTPHQDYSFIQGSTDTLTAWVPLVDCSPESGSLLFLAGSHRLGLWGADWTDAPEGGPSEWHGGPLRAGDVLLFHSLTIHATLRNQGPAIRLTVDYRFSPISEPVAASSLEPHYDIAPWEELYRGWSGTAPRWYWRDLPLALTTREEDIHRLAGHCRSRLLAAGS